MMKRLMTMLCALILTLMATTAFASDSMWRDPNVSMKDWKRVNVVNVITDKDIEGDEFLRQALIYEMVRIGEDKLDDISFGEGHNDFFAPDAYIGVYIKRFEKKYFWIKADSSTYEQRYTTQNTYTDCHGNMRTRYTTHIRTEILDHPPRYSSHSYVHAGIDVYVPNREQAVFAYEAIEDDHEKSPISIYRDIVEDFYKKWKKEMKK